MDSSPGQVYAERLAQRKERLTALEAAKNTVGYFRLIVFLAIAAAIWFAIQGQFPLWVIAIPVCAFVGLVWRQSRIEHDAEFARRAIRFHDAGIARLEHRWQDAGETGERFADPHHPYAGDLDLFGRASLFQLLSTARTRGGEARLSLWLKTASHIEMLRERHAAINELRPMLDLRE